MVAKLNILLIDTNHSLTKWQVEQYLSNFSIGYFWNQMKKPPKSLWNFPRPNEPNVSTTEGLTLGLTG